VTDKIRETKITAGNRANTAKGTIMGHVDFSEGEVVEVVGLVGDVDMAGGIMTTIAEGQMGGIRMGPEMRRRRRSHGRLGLCCV
jgi:hypothetical protein